MQPFGHLALPEARHFNLIGQDDYSQEALGPLEKPARSQQCLLGNL
jgi:hypothetical protein